MELAATRRALAPTNRRAMEREYLLACQRTWFFDRMKKESFERLSFDFRTRAYRAGLASRQAPYPLLPRKRESKLIPLPLLTKSKPLL